MGGRKLLKKEKAETLIILGGMYKRKESGTSPALPTKAPGPRVKQKGENEAMIKGIEFACLSWTPLKGGKGG